MRLAGIASLAIAAALAHNARHACAQVTFGFEPPTYTAGPLIGQDGWVKNTYYGAMNGTVEPSSSSATAAATCCGRTPSSSAMRLLMLSIRRYPHWNEKPTTWQAVEKRR